MTAQAFWQLLYKYGADLVLNGHDHLYARYQPLDPDGKSDPRWGIREFIVGSGGETLDPIALTPVTSAQATAANPETNQEDPSGNVNFNARNLQAYTGDYWGVMGLTLYAERLRVGLSSRHWQVLQDCKQSMVLHFPHRMRMVVIATRASADATVDPAGSSSLIIVEMLGSSFCSTHPPSREIAKGEPLFTDSSNVLSKRDRPQTYP